MRETNPQISSIHKSIVGAGGGVKKKKKRKKHPSLSLPPSPPISPSFPPPTAFPCSFPSFPSPTSFPSFPLSPCQLYVGLLLPETKGRTLEEIEHYFVEGAFPSKSAGGRKRRIKVASRSVSPASACSDVIPE